jgi:hypothetical protein
MKWEHYHKGVALDEWQIKHSNDERSELMVEGIDNLWFVTYKPKGFARETLGKFPSRLKATVFAKQWMKKHPQGV